MIQLIAILCLAVYGALISLLVGLKHDIAERLRVDDSKAGILFSGFMFAGAVGVIVLSASIDLLGHALVARFGFGFTAAALLLLAFCRRYGQYLSVYVLLSVGAMCIISVGNTLLPLVLFGGGNAAAATNLGNGFYGVGAFFVSFFLTGSLQRFGYRATVLFLRGYCWGLLYWRVWPNIPSSIRISTSGIFRQSSPVRFSHSLGYQLFRGWRRKRSKCLGQYLYVPAGRCG